MDSVSVLPAFVVAATLLCLFNLIDDLDTLLKLLRAPLSIDELDVELMRLLLKCEAARDRPLFAFIKGPLLLLLLLLIFVLASGGSVDFLMDVCELLRCSKLLMRLSILLLPLFDAALVTLVGGWVLGSGGGLLTWYGGSVLDLDRCVGEPRLWQ